MRLALAILTLALTGCNGMHEATHPRRDYTVGTSQCSKFKFGTSEMAQCLDRAAESQSATIAGASGTNG